VSQDNDIEEQRQSAKRTRNLRGPLRGRLPLAAPELPLSLSLSLSFSVCLVQPPPPRPPPHTSSEAIPWSHRGPADPSGGRGGAERSPSGRYSRDEGQRARASGPERSFRGPLKKTKPRAVEREGKPRVCKVELTAERSLDTVIAPRLCPRVERSFSYSTAAVISGPVIVPALRGQRAPT
jgi:hypothetical protein